MPQVKAEELRARPDFYVRRWRKKVHQETRKLGREVNRIHRSYEPQLKQIAKQQGRNRSKQYVSVGMMFFDEVERLERQRIATVDRYTTAEVLKMFNLMLPKGTGPIGSAPPRDFWRVPFKGLTANERSARLRNKIAKTMRAIPTRALKESVIEEEEYATHAWSSARSYVESQASNNLWLAEMMKYVDEFNYQNAEADVLSHYEHLATLDELTCEECASLDGTIIETGASDYAPGYGGGGEASAWAQVNIHPNCVVGDTLVSQVGITAVTKRLFEGEVIVIETTGNRRLTCTPNHPVLTREGWVAAHGLNVGDNVICNPVGERVVSVDGDNQEVPARIEDVAGAFLESDGMLTVEVPVATPDFHGDGEGSKVAVVATDGLLGSGEQATGVKKREKVNLILRYITGLLLQGYRALDKRLLGDGSTASSIVSRVYLGGALLLGHVFPLLGLGFALTSELDTGLLELSGDASAVDTVPLAERDGRFSLEVTGDHLIDGDAVGVGGVAQGNAVTFEESIDSVSPDTEALGDILGADAGEVEVDYVLSVSRNPFSGHVYNLQTKSGWYAANSIITHNCRCVPVPVTKSWKDLGFDINEPPQGTRIARPGYPKKGPRGGRDWGRSSPGPFSTQHYVPADVRYGKWKNLKNEYEMMYRHTKIVADNLDDALRQIERSMGDLKNEFGFFLDKDGNMVLMKMGEMDRIHYTIEDVNVIRNSHATVMTHNHPITGGSFSRGDFDMLDTFNLNEMRAVGANYKYSLTPTNPETWSQELLEKVIDPVIEKHSRRLTDLLQMQVNQGKIPWSYLEENLNHMIWDSVARETGLFQYVRTPL